MSDAPTPSASAEPSASDPEPPRRPGTILERIARALREQNWVAVAVELVIVVLGVVIGFQVTSWGEARADRDREQTYLRQLADDLRETESVAEQQRAANRASNRGTARLVQASYAADLAPADSVRRWIVVDGGKVGGADVFLGTARALLSTGDITLIRDDSLRSFLIGYVDHMTVHGTRQAELLSRWWTYFDLMFEHPAFDYPSLYYASLSPGLRDTLARDDPFTSIPPGPRLDAPPVSPAAVLRDRTLTPIFYEQLIALEALDGNLQWTQELSARLREQVEAQIEP